jgi:hypothetical protein
MSYCAPPPAERATRSETATTATTLPPRGVGRGGGNVLDASNAHASAGKSAESRLGAGAGGLGAVSTGRADLDVEGGDAELLAAGGYTVSAAYPNIPSCEIVRTDVLGRQHGSVRRGLVTVGLDLHATSDTRDGFAARQIGDVDESIVEGGEDSGNAKDKLALLYGQCCSELTCAVNLPRGPGVQAAQMSV